MKKGAIELSIGTIVVIVLAMSMLILGLILVQNIFSGSQENVDILSQKVKDNINSLFTENQKTVVYLSDKIAEVKQGDQTGVAFGIKNLNTGTAEAQQFSYEVKLNDADATLKCGVSEQTITSWISTGRTGTIFISPGQSEAGLVRFSVPETSPLCIIRFIIEIKQDDLFYASDFFDIQIA